MKLNNFDVTGSASVKQINKQEDGMNSLEELREYTRILIDIVPSAIFSVDMNCMITSWNERCEMISGYSPQEMIGKNAYILPSNHAEGGVGFSIVKFQSRLQAGNVQS